MKSKLGANGTFCGAHTERGGFISAFSREVSHNSFFFFFINFGKRKKGAGI